MSRRPGLPLHPVTPVDREDVPMIMPLDVAPSRSEQAGPVVVVIILALIVAAVVIVVVRRVRGRK